MCIIYKNLRYSFAFFCIWFYEEQNKGSDGWQIRVFVRADTTEFRLYMEQ